MKIRMDILAVMLVLIVGGWVECVGSDTESLAWYWEYGDDFSSKKAKKDSYDHSIFWPADASPPPEPYLSYCRHHGSPAPGLLFMGYQGRTAYLKYCFPLRPPEWAVEVEGVLSFELIFPLNIPGRFSYSLSPNDQVWTVPTALGPGKHRIRLNSPQGACYVSFMGAAALIDNLKVVLHGPDGTLYVPRDYKTIQAAVNAARPGDTVAVLPGTYSGRGNRDIELRGKAIVVRSTSGAQRTIIDCRVTADCADCRGHRGFYIHEGETRSTRIIGFTIQGGHIPGSEIPPDHMRWNLDPDHPIGAGIYCEFASPSIQNCIITECGTELGAGIGCVGGRPGIFACKIQDCTAGGYGGDKSGGLGGGIGLIRECRASISECKIDGNQGYWNSRGGGVYCYKSNASISKCVILNNGASGNLNGGGVYIGPGSTVSLKRCIIVQNKACAGAGVYSESVNAAEVSGDGILDWAQLRIKNCTIVFNKLSGPQMPPFPGGGIHSLYSDTTVKNSIVWHNEGTPILLIDPPCESPVVYSDVERGYPGAGNIDKDPLFPPVTSAAYPDVHLQSVVGRYNPRTGSWVQDSRHSPCIDRGDPTDSVGSEPRPNGRRINIGAYGGTREASKSKKPTLTPEPVETVDPVETPGLVTGISSQK